MRGIDISNWQKGLIPSSLDIDFCICKATEGLDYTDPSCDVFVQNCIDNNILWGFYHFARENNPEDEAQYFYDNCRNYFNHGIPILDYETDNYDNRDWCERFIQKIYELSGVWCVIYISAYRCMQYNGSWIPEKCGLWVAGYPWENPNWTDEEMPYGIYPWEFCAMWQFTSSLIIPGFWEKLDGDIAYMDENAWLKYANSTGTPPIVEKPTSPEKSTDDLVVETLLGEYGTGEDRKRMLGSRYDEVQNRINVLYEIAEQVIRGDWGNGWNRETALNGAGYPYEIVQKIVNDILA